MVSQEAPRLIFSCGGYGSDFLRNDFVGTDAALDLMYAFKETSTDLHRSTGSCAFYPPSTDIGTLQRLLGQVGVAQLGFCLDAKVPVITSDFKASLGPEKTAKSGTESNEEIHEESYDAKIGPRVKVLYPHTVDVATPLKDQAAGFHAQYQKGLFDELGVCNFSADMLSELVDICEREGYSKPTMYQGLYNLTDRRHEGSVLDLVRKHNMRFVAHSPHGGDFLHGGLTSGQVGGTHFSESNIMSTDARRHEIDKLLDEKLEPHGISKPDAALRWLAFHSKLGPRDAILFSPGEMPQARQNLGAIREGPLPEDVVEALDGVWDVVG